MGLDDILDNKRAPLEFASNGFEGGAEDWVEEEVEPGMEKNGLGGVGIGWEVVEGPLRCRRALARSTNAGLGGAEVEGEGEALEGGKNWALSPRILSRRSCSLVAFVFVS